MVRCLTRADIYDPVLCGAFRGHGNHELCVKADRTMGTGELHAVLHQPKLLAGHDQLAGGHNYRHSHIRCIGLSLCMDFGICGA